MNTSRGRVISWVGFACGTVLVIALCVRWVSSSLPTPAHEMSPGTPVGQPNGNAVVVRRSTPASTQGSMRASEEVSPEREPDLAELLANKSDKEAQTALLSLLAKWYDDSDRAGDVDRILRALLSLEDRFRALDLGLEAIGELESSQPLSVGLAGRTATLMMMMGFWEDEDLLEYGRELMLNDTTPRQKDALMVSILGYSALHPGEIEGLGGDLTQLYFETDDEILRSNIVANSANTLDRETVLELAEESFREPPNELGHYSAWTGFEALQRLYSLAERANYDKNDLQELQRELGQMVVQRASRPDIDLRSFRAAVDTLATIDSSRLAELGGNTVGGSYLKSRIARQQASDDDGE